MTTWTADYLIGDEPYLTIRIAPDRVEVVEFDDAGDRVATTVESTLTRAIGVHGGGALGGQVSRFWQRAWVLAGWFQVWVEVSIPGVRFAFVPAIGLGRLTVPCPLAVPWRAPEPGPIARRIGAVPFDEPDGLVRATMYRTYLDRSEVVSDPIWLHTTTIQGILLAETVAAVYAANGPLRSVAWRPFVENEPVGPVAPFETGAPTTIAIVDDRVADRDDGDRMSLD